MISVSATGNLSSLSGVFLPYTFLGVDGVNALLSVSPASAFSSPDTTSASALNQ